MERQAQDSREAFNKLPPKKLWGCIAAPPRVPIKFTKEAYLFFLAFFFAAILFSSELFRYPPALLAERVFNHHV